MHRNGAVAQPRGAARSPQYVSPTPTTARGDSSVPVTARSASVRDRAGPAWLTAMFVDVERESLAPHATQAEVARIQESRFVDGRPSAADPGEER